MFDQTDFERFCRELEQLRGRSPSIRARAGLTERILAAVKRNRPARRPVIGKSATPLVWAAAIVLIWLFSRLPPARIF